MRRYISIAAACLIMSALPSSGGEGGHGKKGKSEFKDTRSKATKELFIAGYEGDYFRAKELVSAGANVNGRDRRGWTPLHAAVLGGEGFLLDYLVDNGAEVDARDSSGRTPLHIAVAKTGYWIVIWRLISKGADVNARTDGGATPLLYAVVRGDQRLVEILLDKGADPRLGRRGRKEEILDKALSSNRRVRKLISRKLGVEIEADIKSTMHITDNRRCIEECEGQQFEVLKRGGSQTGGCRKACLRDWEHFDRTGEERGCVDFCKRDWRFKKWNDEYTPQRWKMNRCISHYCRFDLDKCEECCERTTEWKRSSHGCKCDPPDFLWGYCLVHPNQAKLTSCE